MDCFPCLPKSRSQTCVFASCPPILSISTKLSHTQIEKHCKCMAAVRRQRPKIKPTKKVLHPPHCAILTRPTLPADPEACPRLDSCRKRLLYTQAGSSLLFFSFFSRSRRLCCLPSLSSFAHTHSVSTTHFQSLSVHLFMSTLLSFLLLFRSTHIYTHIHSHPSHT